MRQAKGCSSLAIARARLKDAVQDAWSTAWGCWDSDVLEDVQVLIDGRDVHAACPRHGAARHLEPELLGGCPRCGATLRLYAGGRT